ncbi:MAG: thiol-disulfide isomerase [Bryobacteraceae bacterium]
MRLCWLFLAATLPVAAVAAASTSLKPTFHKDVLPILQKRCQGCHRAGEAAPMSFLTYEQTRPWAKAIREAVTTRKMPPWFADPHYGKFSNDRSLAQQEIDTLVAWADTGAPAGNAKDAPKPIAFAEGWSIGKPDVVFELPSEFAVPASGTIEYNYIVIPTGFTEDKWIELAEARPGNRAVTHHIIAFVREPGSKWMSEAKPGVPYVPKRRRAEERPATTTGDPQNRNANSNNSENAASVELLVGYAPGIVPVSLRPGQAKLIKAGSDLVLQLHYTANGRPTTDRSRIGIIFARQAPTERVFTTNASNSRFVIPPGASHHEVTAQITLDEEARLVDLMPHMHLRGKDFEYRLVYPTGETQTILRVPRYDFNWQLFYYFEKPLVLPKGTRIECTAHFDNSANKTGNPDPAAEVRWGDQSWEEMMIGWFDLAIGVDKKPGDVTRSRRQARSD